MVIGVFIVEPFLALLAAQTIREPWFVIGVATFPDDPAMLPVVSASVVFTAWTL